MTTIFLTLLVATPGTAQEPLTSEDVVKLTKAGVSDELIIAKVNQAPTVDFDLEVDALLKLREEGVSETVIEAMLARTSESPWAGPASSTAPQPGGPPANPYAGYSQEDLGHNIIRVALSSSEGDVPLRLLRGEFSTVALGTMAFIDYPGLRARTRTSDARPTLLVQSAAPITGSRYFLAKLDVDHDDGLRSLKISSAKGRLKAMFGNSRSATEPDHDWG